MTRYYTPPPANTQPEAEAFWDACDDANHERTQQRRDAEADEAHMRFPAPREDGEWIRAFRESVAQVRALGRSA